MAFFNKPVITEHGLNLLSKALLGEAEIEFVHMAFGSGIYTEDEKKPEKLQMADSLKEQKQISFFSSKSMVDNNRIVLKTLLSNRELLLGYYIYEIGIFARAKGDDDSIILYSVAVANTADYMPKYNGSSEVRIIQEYYTAVHNAANITIVVEDSTFALTEDLNCHVDDESIHITENERSKLEDAYQAVSYIVDIDNIESSFNAVFAWNEDSIDDTALTSEDIEAAISTEWNGESSDDPTALSAEDVEIAISTEWNGESSNDETALSAEDIKEVVG